MREAAEEGTRKVIREHSTIGIVITTDGSITDIPREDYLEAEGRVQSCRRSASLSSSCSTPPTRGGGRTDIGGSLRDSMSRVCLPVNCLELDGAGRGVSCGRYCTSSRCTEACFRMPEWMDAARRPCDKAGLYALHPRKAATAPHP